jgi:hypothetical protein
MNRLLRGLFLPLVIIISGCSLPATPTIVSSPEEAAVATAVLLPAEAPISERLPFEGMWETDGDNPEIIVFTKDNMYLVQSDLGTENYSREKLAKIVSYELTSNHISLRTQWIRINGTMRGFDSPNFTVTYLVVGDTLRIGFGGEGQFEKETGPLVYYRK